MPNQTTNRAFSTKGISLFGYVANENIYQGALVAINTDGKAINASGTRPIMGIAIGEAKAGEVVTVERNTQIPLANDTANPCTAGDVGSVCYASDNQTASISHANNARAKIGLIANIENGTVWVII